MGTNLWQQFVGILPGKPKVYCKVSELVAGGEMKVTTPSGGVMQVAGTGFTVGTAVWVQDGRVIGEAPELDHYNIEV